jgi:hypothetical protein
MLSPMLRSTRPIFAWALPSIAASFTDSTLRVSLSSDRCTARIRGETVTGDDDAVRAMNRDPYRHDIRPTPLNTRSIR